MFCHDVSSILQFQHTTTFQNSLTIKKIQVLVFIPVLLVLFLFLYHFKSTYSEFSTQRSATESKLPVTEGPINPAVVYTPPKIEKKDVYKIAMVGDSMTAILGPHGGILSEYINNLYKKGADDKVQHIIIDNYAKSSNIQAVDEQLEQKVTRSEYTFGPLLSENYDLILVESYAYNPLSQYQPKEALIQQNLALDNIVKKIKEKSPHTAIVFVATIAPNIQNYAKTTEESSSEEQRAKQANERILYLKNHISYAKSHNIPIINIYEKSLDFMGNGDTKYINESDDIHPSEEGVEFISHEIGDYIFNNSILPHE